jgi:hypothetical protein
MVREQLGSLRGQDFGYTQDSVEWLEGYIERLRNSGEFDSAESKNRLTSVFGSFLGECIVRCYDGKWTQHDGVWCVAFSDGDMAFPFAKVAKQFDNGFVDGISSFFRAIPIVFEGRVRPLASAPQKPWWRFW